MRDWTRLCIHGNKTSLLGFPMLSLVSDLPDIITNPKKQDRGYRVANKKEMTVFFKVCTKIAASSLG